MTGDITEFAVSDKLKEYGITRMALIGEEYIKAQYHGIPITATFDPEDITKTMNRFRKEAGDIITSNGVNAPDIINELVKHMTIEATNYIEEVIIKNGGVSPGSRQQNKYKGFIVMKYTDVDAAKLWETVRVGGKFYLVSYDRSLGKLAWYDDGSSVVRLKPAESPFVDADVRELESSSGGGGGGGGSSNTISIRPYSENGIEHYSFQDRQELDQFVQLAKMQTLGTLFEKVKSWVKSFYDTDTEVYTNLITADIIFTYFQDRIGKTHYIFVYGDPDTGKGAILETFNQLAYRSVQITDTTAATIYRLLGSIEKGQVILIIDEANRLEDNPFLLDVLKVGYKGSTKVPRVMDAQSSENSKVEYFYAYCFKIIAAEHLPAQWKTGGFLSRCFQIKTAPGNPAYDIGDIVDNAGDTKNAKIMRELTKLRKLLFAYRLFHYSEPIPDVMIKDITGRDRELIKPLIRLFKTHGDFASLKTVKDTLHYFIKQRNEDKVDSFTAGILKLVKQRIAYNNGGGEDEFELTFSDIWQYVKEQLDGESVEGKPGTIRTDLFGEISTRRLTTTLRNLGGKASKDTTGNKRVWAFDSKTLGRFSTVYRQIPDIIELEEQATLDSTTAYDDDDNNEEGLQSSDSSDTSDRSF